MNRPGIADDLLKLTHHHSSKIISAAKLNTSNGYIGYGMEMGMVISYQSVVEISTKET